MIALFAYRSFKKWQKGENLFEDDCESIDNCAEDSIFYDFKQIKSFENQLKTAKNDKNGKEEPFKEMKKKRNSIRIIKKKLRNFGIFYFQRKLYND